MKKKRGLFSLRLLILAFISLCSSTTLALAESTSIRTVGYLPDYDYVNIERVIDFRQLTDVNYFSIIPQKDGKLKFTDSGSGLMLEKLRIEAHKEDVRVGVSIGGWGMSSNFVEATNSQHLSEFVKEIVMFAKKYKLDTIDIDWEYPSVDETDQFTKLILLLQESLPKEIALSICVPTGVAANGRVTDNWEYHFPAEALRAADWVNIMSYDAQVEGMVNHSPRELQKNSLNYWNELMGGNQIHKLVGGVPFYGKATNGAVMTYGNMMAKHGRVIMTDNVTVNGVEYHFNNKETVQGKVQDTIDLGALGIMVWAPTQDSDLNDSNRLMDVIDNTIKENNVTLDKKKFMDEEAEVTENIFRDTSMLLVSMGLLILGTLFSKGRLFRLLPSKIYHRHVNRRQFGKAIGIIVSFIGIVIGLLRVIPLYIVMISLTGIFLAILYLIKE